MRTSFHFAHHGDGGFGSRREMRRVLLPLLVGVMVLTQCLLAPLCPAAYGFALEEDEKRLWSAAEDAEKLIDGSGLVYHNPELQTYLQGILTKLAPPDALSELPLTISVIRTPYLNAVAFPNGRIYISEGALARIENEAQLATILGHEMIHVFHRHALQEVRNAKSKAGVLVAVNSITANLLASLSHIGAVGMMQGYSRDLEREADQEGLRLMVTAGYDLAEATKVFLIFQEETDNENISRSGLYSDHPCLDDRIDDYAELVHTTFASHKGGATYAGGYVRVVAPLYLDAAALDLKRGRLDVARHTLESLLRFRGEDAHAYFLLGESWRQVGGEEEEEQARSFYDKAIAVDPAYAEPYRAIGVSAYKNREWELARRTLERYLALAPQAPDRLHVEQMLKNVPYFTKK